MAIGMPSQSGNTNGNNNFRNAFGYDNPNTGNQSNNPLNAQQGSSLNNQYNLYNTATQQQAEDYSGIMKKYNDLYSQAGSQSGKAAYIPQQVNYSNYQYSAPTIVPHTVDYTESPDLQNSIDRMQGLADTGGYSEGDISNLRERGVSPIRSIYANAQREMSRNRALKGGFSPGYNAASEKMSRSMSDQMANQMTNVNAGIAQNVASNKLNIAPQLANLVAGQSNLQNQIAQFNAGAMNTAGLQGAQMQQQGQLANNDLMARIAQFNAGAQNEAGQFNATSNANGLNNQARIIQGMQGLYGTTPALTNLFGNQALQGSEFQNRVNQQGNANNLNLIGKGLNGMQ